MKDEWFRRTSWTAESAAEFERRLNRARPTGRAQYLRIQAGHLLAAGDAKSALVLAERAVHDPLVGIQLAPAHLTRGDCYRRLRDLPRALGAYRAAVETEAAVPTVKTDAYLEFAWTVATEVLRADYDEASRLLDAFADRPAFPVQHFRQHASRALIAFDCGAHDVAWSEAKLALHAADADSSGLQYHRKLGLVTEQYEDIRTRLRKLAADG